MAKRLNKANVPCDLITGQEREEVDGAKHKAVTVEMADVTTDYDCAVIDEIQACWCLSESYFVPFFYFPLDLFVIIKSGAFLNKTNQGKANSFSCCQLLSMFEIG